MESIREYILSVIAAGLLCGVVRHLIDKKGVPGAVGKLLTGIVMMFSILAPLSDLSFGSALELKMQYHKIAQEAVLRGEKITGDSMRKSISESLEAYLLDKARQMGLELQVQVTVSDDLYPVPQKVCISGNISPYAKKRLVQIIEEELGVKEDDQQWR